MTGDNELVRPGDEPFRRTAESIVEAYREQGIVPEFVLERGGWQANAKVLDWVDFQSGRRWEKLTVRPAANQSGRRCPSAGRLTMTAASTGRRTCDPQPRGDTSPSKR